MIDILKASAGSGKTYNLAKKYISLLLESGERDAYRHVLAVTFTNKATAEMKARILRELHTLATDTPGSKYYGDFVPSMFPDAQSLREVAKRSLIDILHDYSAFSVSTIDKFFQRALKSFAREIGYYASYQVRIDREALIQEAVDRMLDALTAQDRAVLDWLSDEASEQLQQGRHFSVERSLYNVCTMLKSIEHASLASSLGIDDRTAYSKQNISSVSKACSAVMAAFESEVKSEAAAAIAILSDSGLSPGDTNRGWMRKIESYAKAGPGDRVEAPSDAVIDRCLDPDKWFTKANAPRMLPMVVRRLAPVLERLAALFRDSGGGVSAHWRDYSTAVIIKGEVHTLGLAREFYDSFDALVKEENVMSLDDSNTLLRRIIDGSDVPFVYEKLGVWYEHFLLDEFQDTSGVQWDNFRPLLHESNDRGRDNLVVGDIKQSIYRWRGSDWSLLSELPREFDGPSRRVTTLSDNWRSLRRIVEFNNSFFRFCSSKMDEVLGLEGEGSVSGIYADVEQTARTGDPQEGHVRVSFCGDGEDYEDVLEAVLDAVRSARDAGARWRDIAILVRRHEDGGAVADALVGAGVPVISDDSLTVKSSPAVRRIVSLMSCVDNPDDAVNGYLAKEMGLEYTSGYHSLADLCESLVRLLRSDRRGISGGDVLYVQSFMDMVQEWSTIHGNNLSEFLKYWEGQNPKTVSPEDADSVTVMTIHKSKGLQFPCVIFPFAEGVGRHQFGDNRHWCSPDVSSGPLLPAGKLIYPVNVSGKLVGTLFEDCWRRERLMMAVDDTNLAYVAFTRAEKSLRLIALRPKDSALKTLREGSLPGGFDLSHLLYLYCMERGREFGSPYEFVRADAVGDEAMTFGMDWPSVPIGDRLSFGADNSDFFADGIPTGRSPRLRGIVLHDILSMIDSPSQLRSSVDAVVADGDMSAEDGEAAFRELYPRVLSKVAMGWFDSGDEPHAVPSGGGSHAPMRNEVSIFDTDGELYRPDRVVTGTDGSVTVIDYKFGEQRRKYVSQVRRYMSLYRRMGFPMVRGYLWYVDQDIVQQVEQ